MIADHHLPSSWSLAPLKLLGEWRGGGTPAKNNRAFWSAGTIPWVSPKDMKRFRIRDTEDHITSEAVESSATSVLPTDSVLIVTRSGILRHTLPVAVNEVPVTINQDLKGLELHDGFDARYVAWALRRFADNILQHCSKGGTTVQSIVFPSLLEFKIPVAPLPEQRRIVAAIEEQFSRIDAGVDALRRALARINGMESVASGSITRAGALRIAILREAFRGNLVAQDPTDEPAQILLDRIRAARTVHESVTINPRRRVSR